MVKTNIRWVVSDLDNLIEGYVGNDHFFTIEGSLCVTDLRGIHKEDWEAPKYYKIGKVDNHREVGKIMAYEILNGINEDKYLENLRLQKIESDHTIELLKEAQDFLDSLRK